MGSTRSARVHGSTFRFNRRGSQLRPPAHHPASPDRGNLARRLPTGESPLLTPQIVLAAQTREPQCCYGSKSSPPASNASGRLVPRGFFSLSVLEVLGHDRNRAQAVQGRSSDQRRQLDLYRLGDHDLGRRDEFAVDDDPKWPFFVVEGGIGLSSLTSNLPPRTVIGFSSSQVNCRRPAAGRCCMGTPGNIGRRRSARPSLARLA
jgi:hypothetical protein